MHHSLKIYGKYRGLFLKYYIFQSKWTAIPLIGKIVKWVANLYGKKSSNAYLLTLDEARLQGVLEEVLQVAEGYGRVS